MPNRTQTAKYNLEIRQKLYDSMKGDKKPFKRPGSQNPRKQL